MDFFVGFGCALQFIFWKLIKKNIAVGIGIPFQRQDVSGNNTNTSQTQCKQILAHKIGQPHQTAANQIVPKFFLYPHLTKCRWGTHVLGISTLCGYQLSDRRSAQLGSHTGLARLGFPPQAMIQLVSNYGNFDGCFSSIICLSRSLKI